MKAFQRFKECEILIDNRSKHQHWLEDYEGLYFGIGENGQDWINWSTEKEKYIYSKKRFGEPILCLDGRYRAEPNKIQRHPRRLTIEFDGDEKTNETRDTAQKILIEVKEYIKAHGWSFILSSHNSKNGSDYLHVEFNREISDDEAKKFLIMLCDKFGGKVDTNFFSSNKRFPVLFATHWKYPKERELPIEYFEGEQIDFDKLIFDKPKGKFTKSFKDGNEYYNYTGNNKEHRSLNSIRMSDFLKGKIQKEKPIIEDLIPEQTITAIFGEPGSCKSLLVNYIGSCVSTGSKFLNNKKCRKVPVLNFSTEVHNRIDRKRFKAIHKGMGINPIRRKYDNLQLEYLPREFAGILNDDNYFQSFKARIVDSKIKLLIIDTLSPLIADTNDNQASEIVKIFNYRLFPLVNELGLSILFLLHSQKTGKDFLGTIKYKASVDLFYELKREDNNTLNLYCHKGREGELNFEFKIEFTNKPNLRPYKVGFTYIKSYEGKQSPLSKGVETNKIDQAKDIILLELGKDELFHSQLVKLGEIRNISIETMKRAIKILYESHQIRKRPGKKGGYYIP